MFFTSKIQTRVKSLEKKNEDLNSAILEVDSALQTIKTTLFATDIHRFRSLFDEVTRCQQSIRNLLME